MRKILFIINPISGDVDKTAAKEQIEQFCPARGWAYEILETTGTDDDRRIRSAIETFRPDTVVAGGGDGTVNLVGKTLLGRPDCRLGILPLGSANGLAQELGIVGNVTAALQVLEQGRVITADALVLQDEHYCFHLADIGYNARLIEGFERGDTRGRLGYLREAFHTLRDRPVGKFHLSVDGEVLRTRAVMITFANGRYYGTGAIVNPDGEIDDGRFELCLYRPWPRWQLVWMLLLSFLGRPDASRWVKIRPARRVDVTVDRPLPLQADGELLGRTDQVTVRLAKEKLRIWVPN